MSDHDKPTACLSSSRRAEDEKYVRLVDMHLQRFYKVERQELEKYGHQEWVAAFLDKASSASLLVSLVTPRDGSAPITIAGEAALFHDIKTQAPADAPKKFLVLLHRSLLPATMDYFRDMAESVHPFDGYEDLNEILLHMIPELARNSSPPSVGNLDVLKSDIVCTIARDGHAIIKYTHRIRATQPHKVDGVPIDLGIGSPAPLFNEKEPIAPLNALLEANVDPRRDKQIFRYRILQSRSDRTFWLKDLDLKREPTWVLRKIWLQFSEPLAKDEVLEYTYSWATPNCFKRGGPEFFMHKPNHRVKQLSITLRFPLDLGSNPPDPWGQIFEYAPHLRRDEARQDPGTAPEIDSSPTLHFRRYHWLFKDVPSERQINIDWTTHALSDQTG